MEITMTWTKSVSVLSKKTSKGSIYLLYSPPDYKSLSSWNDSLGDHEVQFLMTGLLSPGDEGKPNVEVIILVCTGAAATFLWLMLILFIRKLRKVRRHTLLLSLKPLESYFQHQGGNSQSYTASVKHMPLSRSYSCTNLPLIQFWKWQCYEL